MMNEWLDELDRSLEAEGAKAHELERQCAAAGGHDLADTPILSPVSPHTLRPYSMPFNGRTVRWKPCRHCGCFVGESDR